MIPEQIQKSEPSGKCNGIGMLSSYALLLSMEYVTAVYTYYVGWEGIVNCDGQRKGNAEKHRE